MEKPSLETRMALVEQKLDLILDNHLAHMQKDMDAIKRIMWMCAVGVISTLATLVIQLVL